MRVLCMHACMHRILWITRSNIATATAATATVSAPYHHMCDDHRQKSNNVIDISNVHTRACMRMQRAKKALIWVCPQPLLAVLILSLYREYKAHSECMCIPTTLVLVALSALYAHHLSTSSFFTLAGFSVFFLSRHRVRAHSHFFTAFQSSS